MFKHILVAVSNVSDSAALRAAIKLAHEHGASVSAVHVVDWMPRLLMLDGHDLGPTLACLQAQADEIIAQTKGLLDKAGCRGEARAMTLSAGDFSVGRLIAGLACDIDADLIVLGKAKSGWWRWFDEDVSIEVKRHAAAPVLIASNDKPLMRPHFELALVR